jgi:hypothetical protein
VDERQQTLGMAAADDLVALIDQPIAIEQRDRTGRRRAFDHELHLRPCSVRPQLVEGPTLLLSAAR